MNKYLWTALVGIVLIGGSILAFQSSHAVKKETSVKSGDYFPIPSIEASDNYGKDFKTYTSDLGFSFKYPPHLQAIHDPEMPNWILLTPIDETADATSTSAIIVSTGDNNEMMTPEEWLLGPTSGFDHSKKYFKTTIDGQNAVYTDGGMWTVVNTPDNKYRLSIADYTHGNADRPFTEMGIVVESLTFKH